jgi:hypothetical protein
MTKEKLIIHDNVLLAKLILGDTWNEGLSFYSDEKDFIQVGTWKYNSGKELLAHKHNIVPRNSDITQEVIYVKNGKLLAKIYDLNNAFLEEHEMRSGDCMIMLRGGHSYTILEDDTEVLEVKNGPYFGPEIDRVRF